MSFLSDISSTLKSEVSDLVKTNISALKNRAVIRPKQKASEKTIVIEQAKLDNANLNMLKNLPIYLFVFLAILAMISLFKK